jgi:hypothetical protein
MLTRRWDSPADMLSKVASSRALSASSRALLGAACLVFGALGGLGCTPPAPVKKPPQTAVDPTEQAKIDEGRLKIDEANRAINEKNHDEARKLLLEARALAVDSQTFEIEEVTEKLDKREAKFLATQVADSLKAKDCANVVKKLSDRIKELTSDAFTKELRRALGEGALKCLQSEVDDKVLAATYADARKLANTPEARSVLGQAAQKKLAAEVEVTILDALRGQIDDELKAKKWALAVEKIDASVKRGDATDEQSTALLASVREGIAPEIIAAAQRALGAGDAPKALRQVDALIHLARWELVPPADGTALAKDRVPPPDVAKKREALAVWVEAQRVNLTMLKRPDKRWANGKIAVTPPSNRDAPSRRDVRHGAELWVLGTTKDGRGLLAGADPGVGPITGMFDKVVGWAPLSRLAIEATGDWVVPDDQLKGERVWGPLRKDATLWELGIVADVSGKEISVKRIADDAVVKVTRKQLRNGRLAPGTRVVALCGTKDQPAKIAAVLPTGSVKIRCDTGEEKEDILASLRSKPDLLPPSK